MPALTFRVATHEAKRFKDDYYYRPPPAQEEGKPRPQINSKQIYTQLNPVEYRSGDKIWLSSLDSYRGPLQQSANASFPLKKIIPQEKSGLVQTVYHAYDNHRHLVLRPDDLWISIISQFALYLENKEHSEALREWFTDSGPGEKKNIHVEVENLSQMPTAFRAALSDIVLDKELIPWIIPDFSTTTQQDREVASYLLMGALKNYFTYSSMCACGIPSVTLLGEKKDYEEILRRVNYLDKFGQADLSQWAKLLRAVMQKAFIDPFDMDDEESRAKVVNTWENSVHYHSMSGRSDISGWLTAFTFFGKKGKQVLRICRVEPPRQIRVCQLGPDGKVIRSAPKPPVKIEDPSAGLIGTGDDFGMVNTKDIAPGFSEVDIKVFGLLPDLAKAIDMKAIAGGIGIGHGVLVEGEGGVEVSLSAEGPDDNTVFPVNAWWIIEQEEIPENLKKMYQQSRWY